MTGSHPADRPEPTSIPVLKRVLRYGALLAVGIAVVGAVLGFVFAGGPGALGALIGAVLAGVLLAVTAFSIILGNRFDVGGFFGIVMGAWLLKFVLFLVAAFLLKDQPWLNTTAMFLAVIVAVLGSLVIDVVVVARARMPYVSDLGAGRRR